MVAAMGKPTATILLTIMKVGEIHYGITDPSCPNLSRDVRPDHYGKDRETHCYTGLWFADDSSGIWPFNAQRKCNHGNTKYWKHLYSRLLACFQ